MNFSGPIMPLVRTAANTKLFVITHDHGVFKLAIIPLAAHQLTIPIGYSITNFECAILFSACAGKRASILETARVAIVAELAKWHPDQCVAVVVDADALIKVQGTFKALARWVNTCASEAVIQCLSWIVVGKLNIGARTGNAYAHLRHAVGRENRRQKENSLAVEKHFGRGPRWLRVARDAECRRKLR